MKLNIIFGPSKPQQVNWWKPLEEFPKLFKYEGKKWEWFMYQESTTCDYELVFSEIPPYDPNYHVTLMDSFDDMFGSFGPKCECGANHSASFPWDHMRMCKLWKPWDRL